MVGFHVVRSSGVCTGGHRYCPRVLGAVEIWGIQESGMGPYLPRVRRKCPPGIWLGFAWYPAVLGGNGVIRLSVGKLLVGLLQVVKQTITPPKPQHANDGPLSA